MDNSGVVLAVCRSYEQGWTDDDKMEKTHEFRLRMITTLIVIIFGQVLFTLTVLKEE